MYVFYEEEGSFKAGKILSAADSTLQIETMSGKRIKLKRTQVAFEFSQPEPDALLTQAHSVSADMEITFLWECAPTGEFSIAQFAQDYFGSTPSSVQLAALTHAIHGAPVYFHRKGKGLYQAAPPAILEAALAAIEKKQQQAALQHQWVEQMLEGILPEELKDQASQFLIKPDKNSMGWKAFQSACEIAQLTPERLLLKLGVYESAYQLHKLKFIHEHFSKGTQAPTISIPNIARDLNLSTAVAYSIDDKNTTEIDDALSVTYLDNSTLEVGIHIAAPALVVKRDHGLDKSARERMSTVYLPGEKIPMQSSDIVEHFSLDEGVERPCISLYAIFDINSCELRSHRSSVERIIVTKNLRIHALEPLISEDKLEDHTDSSLPYPEFFRPLWHIAKALAKKREEIRGKPEQNDRIEYSIEVQSDFIHPDEAIIDIIQRKRNAPIDRMVGEYMILANSLWAGMLAQADVPGIFRSQQLGRVKVSTYPGPHDTIGVSHYAWHTSPLRRYVDLLNQGQLISVIDNGISARLVAPFKPKEADLYAIIEAFDAKYQAYNEFQRSMENFWCLVWLKQRNIQKIQAYVIKEDLVRLEGMPFYTRVANLPELERDQLILLEIIDMDTIDLRLETRYIGTLQSHQLADII